MRQIGHPFTIRDNPTVDAQFSAQYTAALTFIHGRPKIRDFQIENVVGRREVIKDSTAVGHAAMKVVLNDGKCVNDRVESAKGSPTNPQSITEQDAKFEDCLNSAVWACNAEKKARILSTVRDIENFEDFAQFVDSLHNILGESSS